MQYLGDALEINTVKEKGFLWSVFYSLFFISQTLTTLDLGKNIGWIRDKWAECLGEVLRTNTVRQTDFP